jgi:hypothetical protein
LDINFVPLQAVFAEGANSLMEPEASFYDVSARGTWGDMIRAYDRHWHRAEEDSMAQNMAG